VADVSDAFTQDWDVYMVLTSDLKLATYMDLDTRCNMEDLNNMLEIMELKHHFDAMAEKYRQQQEASK
jgi:hypothetical protein